MFCSKIILKLNSLLKSTDDIFLKFSSIAILHHIINRDYPMSLDIPFYQIRAMYNDKTIRVYQAYSDSIANSALEHGTFVCPPFKKDRMTWIKPSFLWMMYRSRWGLKDEGQKRILAIDITHEGFEWALSHSCLSHSSPAMSKEEWLQLKRNSPVRIQWDPERDLFSTPQNHRAIQIGLSNEAVDKYLNEWIVEITDITPIVSKIHKLTIEGQITAALNLIPKENEYVISTKTKNHIIW